MDEAWSVDALVEAAASASASFGISLDMVPLPMSSSEISRAEMPAIYPRHEPGARPQHRRHLPDDPQLRARRHHPGASTTSRCSALPRTGTAPGRGAVALQRVRLRPGAKQDPPLTIAGTRRRRHVLGAHHLFPRAGRAGRRGIQGEDGLPSAGSGRAEGHGLARRRCRARHRPTG